MRRRAPRSPRRVSRSGTAIEAAQLRAGGLPCARRRRKGASERRRPAPCSGRARVPLVALVEGSRRLQPQPLRFDGRSRDHRFVAIDESTPRPRTGRGDAESQSFLDAAHGLYVATSHAVARDVCKLLRRCGSPSLPQRLDRLTIQYVMGGRSSDISPRAVFLASWLAERLGWTLDADGSSNDGDDSVFAFRAGERAVTVRFIGVTRSGLEGLISSAKLEATSSPSASFTVTRAERNRLASEVVLDGRMQTSRVTSYASRTELELLSTELGIVGRDRLYEAAVAIAGQIGAVPTK